MGAVVELPDKAGSTVRIRVKGGYRPATIHGRAGERLRLVFRREESAACSEHVVFPDFGKSAMLPAFEDVELELLPERAGEYEFTCQLGMLRGRLIVSGPGTSEATRTRPPSSSWAEQPSDVALLGVVVWLCSLPLLLLVSVPLFGWWTGGLLAFAWLAIVAGVCFAVCVRRLHASTGLR